MQKVGQKFVAII